MVGKTALTFFVSSPKKNRCGIRARIGSLNKVCCFTFWKVVFANGTVLPPNTVAIYIAGKSQDEIDQFAMNQTLFHWGLPGWSQYILVAICAGLASFKFNLPLTYRSCFYPLLGDYTWGWIGDVIDGFAIVTTIAGVCTSLGLGILQIVDGMKYLDVMDLDASTDDEVRAAVIVIWVITAISVCSLLTGIHKGIKYLSQIGFSLANLLLFLVLVMDKTSFIFNPFFYLNLFFMIIILFSNPQWKTVKN